MRGTNAYDWQMSISVHIQNDVRKVEAIRWIGYNQAPQTSNILQVSIRLTFQFLVSFWLVFRLLYPPSIPLIPSLISPRILVDVANSLSYPSLPRLVDWWPSPFGTSSSDDYSNDRSSFRARFPHQPSPTPCILWTSAIRQLLRRTTILNAQ